MTIIPFTYAILQAVSDVLLITLQQYIYAHYSDAQLLQAEEDIIRTNIHTYRYNYRRTAGQLEDLPRAGLIASGTVSPNQLWKNA